LRGFYAFCIMLRGFYAFCIMLRGFYAFCIMLRGFYAFCIMLRGFYAFCIMLRGFYAFCIMLRGFYAFCIMRGFSSSSLVWWAGRGMVDTRFTPTSIHCQSLRLVSKMMVDNAAVPATDRF